MSLLLALHLLLIVVYHSWYDRSKLWTADALWQRCSIVVVTAKDHAVGTVIRLLMVCMLYLCELRSISTKKSRLCS